VAGLGNRMNVGLKHKKELKMDHGFLPSWWGRHFTPEKRENRSTYFKQFPRLSWFGKTMQF
jgi:hypothetical protein